MGHFIAPDVTSRDAQSLHAGMNYVRHQYTLSETASASVTIAIGIIPGGARLGRCVLTWDTAQLDQTGAGNVSVKSWTGTNDNGPVCATAAASTTLCNDVTDDAMNGYRHTASSHFVVKLSNFAATGTGTATTIFTLVAEYSTAQDKD